MTRRALLASLSVLTAFGQSSQKAFGKSMLITKDERGKTQKIKGVLHVEPEQVSFRAKKGGPVFETAYSDVTKLIYERTKKPRYSVGLLLAWPLLFTKEKQHYITIESKGNFAFVKVHKSDYRWVITALENASEMTVERLVE